MPSKPPAVYWDACCFIGRIQRESDKIADLEHLVSLAEKGKLLIVTSTLTIAEVLHNPDDSGDEDQHVKLVKKYFEHPWISLRSIDRRISELAAAVRLKHGLKVADAVHVATALRWKLKVLHTYDERDLLKRHGLIGNPPLEIIKPRYPEDLPLFDKTDEGTHSDHKEVIDDDTNDAPEVENRK